MANGEGKTLTAVNSPVDFVTLSGLKSEYNLTPKWITMLGDPDKLKTNPRYKSASPMRLYLRKRVNALIAENSEAYEAMREKRLGQSQRAKAAAERQRQANLAWAREVEIEFGALPDDLQKSARIYFGTEFDEMRGPDAEINERGIIAMLRHRYCNYHQLLDKLFGEVGRWEAYPIIRDRVNRQACLLVGIDFGQASDWSSGEDRWLSGRWGERVGTQKTHTF